MQAGVKTEVENLLKDGYIKRVDKMNDEVFIQSVVLTVKKDQTVKVALDSRSVNNAIQKDKDWIPKLDNLIEQVAELIKSTDDRKILFNSLDMLCSTHTAKQN